MLVKQSALRLAFYNNRPSLIVIVTKLAENFTKNNSKYIMKRVILSIKNKKLFGLWVRLLCKRIQLISVKTHQMKKVQTHRYSLKYKKLKMQIGQFWFVVNFFLWKINRLFLIRDAKFKMNQEKKSVEFKFFFRRNWK
jgi:hypothetical protein